MSSVIDAAAPEHDGSKPLECLEPPDEFVCPISVAVADWRRRENWLLERILANPARDDTVNSKTKAPPRSALPDAVFTAPKTYNVPAAPKVETSRFDTGKLYSGSGANSEYQVKYSKRYSGAGVSPPPSPPPSPPASSCPPSPPPSPPGPSMMSEFKK